MLYLFQTKKMKAKFMVVNILVIIKLRVNFIKKRFNTFAFFQPIFLKTSSYAKTSTIYAH